MAGIDNLRPGSRKGRRLAPELLRGMRRVYRSKGLEGDPKLCEMYQSDYPRFLDRMERLEKEYLNRKAKVEAASSKAAGGAGPGAGTAAPTIPPPAADLGTAACLDLIDKLLGS